MEYRISYFAKISTYEARVKIFSAKLALERIKVATPGLDKQFEVLVQSNWRPSFWGKVKTSILILQLLSRDQFLERLMGI
jgi:hypothetical protein